MNMKIQSKEGLTALICFPVLRTSYSVRHFALQCRSPNTFVSLAMKTHCIITSAAAWRSSSHFHTLLHQVFCDLVVLQSHLVFTQSSDNVPPPYEKSTVHKNQKRYFIPVFVNALCLTERLM
ncbi:hypothetical protein BaRGS_00035112 [Batillaria attramentaria]|uniref:Uncharacterized protein n=1 Tax=Batillaria attramentaria TaxID=370345 RepID=A0ABD0JF25_9CAEN